MPRLATIIALAVAIAALAACGEDEAEQPTPEVDFPRPTLNEILNDPEAHDVVTARGSASPLGNIGFVLTQQGVSMLVTAPPGQVERLQDGDDVELRARVETLTRGQVRSIERQVELNQGEGDEFAERAYADTRVEEGAPYLELLDLEVVDT